MVNRVQKAPCEDTLHIMVSKTRRFAVRVRVGRRVIQNNSLVSSPKTTTPSEASKSYKLASALGAVFFLGIALLKKELVWFLSLRFV